VAAVPKGKVDQAAVVFQRTANFSKQTGTDQVAMRVVDLLEVVEVDKYQRKLVVITLRPVDFGLENKTHVTGVVQRRAVVGNGQLVDALDVARIFEGDRGEIGKRFEQFEVARIESLRTDAINQLDHTQAGIAEFDGDGDDRPRLHLGFLVDLAEKTRVLGGI